LDLSKIESGKMQLKYEIINPHSIFTEISQIFTHKIESKGLDFVLDISPEIPKGLYFDEIRFRQILFNLIGNAVKFTSEGYVRLSAKCDFNNDNTVEFSFTVSDTGIGIKENQQNKILA